MAREDLHFRLRIPEALKDLIEEHATLNERSMTAEIIDRLRDSFDRWPNISIPDDLKQQVVEELPVGVLFPLEEEIQNLVINRTIKALQDHKLSQSNLLSLFEEAIEHAPVEKQAALRKELKDLMLHAKIGIHPF